MNVKIIDKTGKFIIYDKRNTLLITADMAQAGKLAELIQMYFSLEYWQRREVAEHGNEKICALLRYLDRVDRMSRKRQKAAYRTRIERDVNISRYQNVVFIKGTELGDLYEAMRKRWTDKNERFCNAFDASLFYNLGFVHGVQEERARRKRRSLKLNNELLFLKSDFPTFQAAFQIWKAKQLLDKNVRKYERFYIDLIRLNR